MSQIQMWQNSQLAAKATSCTFSNGTILRSCRGKWGGVLVFMREPLHLPKGDVTETSVHCCDYRT